MIRSVFIRASPSNATLSVSVYESYPVISGVRQSLFHIKFVS